jgi:uncharacterized RDD family membrane protein YckC
VKCPKCGFVSFPGLPRCRKCGSSFDSPSERSTFNPPSSDDLEDEVVASSSQFASSSPRALTEPPVSGAAVSRRQQSTSAKDDTPAGRLQIIGAASQPQEVVNTQGRWTNEISERVASFRRRREATNSSSGQELNLPFNNVAPLSETESAVLFPSWREGSKSGKSHPDFDVVFGERASGQSSSNFELLPRFDQGAPAPAQRGPELNIKRWPKTQSAPDDLLESDFAETTPVPASDFADILSAPLGKRFVAGVLDGLILSAAACIFAVVFWLVGGSIQFGPLNFAVLLVVIVFWLFTYFAAFSALSFSTPGEAAMGLSVRNFDGEFPTRQECLLRAFGYLVSITSVMLGFLWAAMDSDRLAWHDHISGTFLTDQR